jgi:hypothetical protein
MYVPLGVFLFLASSKTMRNICTCNQEQNYPGSTPRGKGIRPMYVREIPRMSGLRPSYVILFIFKIKPLF